jgi:16S rRNA C1402 N4-methylase RsmH
MRKDVVSLTKKPVAPTLEEIRDNPRSRSSKLRIFEKK